MDELRVDDIPKLGTHENDVLIAPFTEKEVFEAISQMKNNKAPGPDGFPAEFYKRCWNIIKGDLLPMFQDLFDGNLQLFHLNFGTITLLPKKEGAVRIEQFRPICLLNVSFKVFTKVGTNRLTQIAHEVVQPSQTAFMPDRNILEGVVVLHETLHEIHSKKLDGVIFKVDFKKAYDKVKWSFLQQALRMKGFDEIWRKQVESFVQKGSVGIRVNDDIGHYFQTFKGLRQGDPMSPILFNVVADMLAILIGRAKQEGQIGGLVPHLVDGGVSILQYADDTILFLEHDIAKARNMKLILCLFEQLSGLKINFHKSELFCFGKAKEEQNTYKQLFGCEMGNLPFNYLGIPIHHRKLSNSEWKCTEDRFEKKLSCWKGKLLSYGGRLILINSVLTSMPMFLLSFFEVPVGVRRRLDFYRSRFFWQADGDKTKYRLARWDIICRPKDQGGLGIENLEVKNRCLLSKWLFRL
uniref:Reverse transcriptase domain-containing protein n=1 Tax=Hordeum vulgare subsp. vulgare TaxID=112509 RepID=A0A8I6XZE3_HORVV